METFALHGIIIRIYYLGAIFFILRHRNDHRNVTIDAVTLHD